MTGFGTQVADPGGDSLDELAFEQETILEEKAMAIEARDKRMDCREMFRSKDPLRKGLCTATEFCRMLALAFATPFTQTQLDVLCRRYSIENGMVNYERFSEKIDQIINSSTLGSSGTFAEDNALESLTQAEQDELSQLISKMRDTIKFKQLLLKPVILGFDRMREQTITREQFLRVLSMFHLLPRSTASQDLLCRRYSSSPSSRRVGGGYIAYRLFLADVEKDTAPTGSIYNGGDPGGNNEPFATTNEDMTDQVRSPLGRAGDAMCGTLSSSLCGRPADRPIERVLQDLKQKVMMLRIRTTEFFKDADKLRSGSISREVFSRSLLAMGVKLSPNEMSGLCDTFACPGTLVDAEGESYVRWREFCDELDQVFTVKNLVKCPLADVHAEVEDARGLNSSNIDNMHSHQTLEEEEELKQVLKEIALKLKKRRVQLGPILHDFDKFQRGCVNEDAFARCLSLAGVMPSVQGMDLIAEKFKEMYTTVDTHPDINYKAFLAALDMLDSGLSSLPDALDCRLEQQRTGIDASMAISLSNLSHAKTLHGTFAEGVSLDETLKEMAKQLAFRSADIRDHLASHDKNHSGCVTPSNFKAAMALAGVQLNEEEMTCLDESFRSSKYEDMIDWIALTDAIQEASEAPAEASDIGRRAPKSTKQGEALQRALDAIRTRVRQRRLDLEPCFVDFDAQKKGSCTSSHFFGVLSTVGGFQLQPQEVEAILHNYEVRDRCSKGAVAYAKFVKDVSPAALS
ncbi:unnamed protein product [Chrysoparadoxa australica]